MDVWKEEPRILVAYPGMGSPHEISEKWAESLHEIRLAYPNAKTLTVTGYPIDEARNQCALTAMDKNFDYLFFLDQDVIAPPDVIRRLLSHQVDVVGGIYRQKMAQNDWCVFMANKNSHGQDVKTTVAPTGDLIRVDYLATGCLLIHRRVFQVLPYPWFRWTLNPLTNVGKSEDFYFTDLCRKSGIDVYADTSIKCSHICSCVLTERGYERL